MKKKLTLLIFLLPFVAFSQTQYNKDGTISIDFGKKKQQQVDTPKPEKIIYPSDEEEAECVSTLNEGDVIKLPREGQNNNRARLRIDFRVDEERYLCATIFDLLLEKEIRSERVRKLR